MTRGTPPSGPADSVTPPLAPVRVQLASQEANVHATSGTSVGQVPAEVPLVG